MRVLRWSESKVAWIPMVESRLFVHPSCRERAAHKPPSDPAVHGCKRRPVSRSLPVTTYSGCCPSLCLRMTLGRSTPADTYTLCYITPCVDEYLAVNFFCYLLGRHLRSRAGALLACVPIHPSFFRPIFLSLLSSSSPQSPKICNYAESLDFRVGRISWETTTIR